MLRFCLNEISFSETDTAVACKNLYEANRGMFYYIQKKKERFVLYQESENPIITEGLTYKDYLRDLKGYNAEMFAALVDAASSCPYEEELSVDDEIYRFSNCYIDNQPMNQSLTLPFAHTRNATLVSQNTNLVWDSVLIEFKNSDEPENKYYLKNISTINHGHDIYYDEYENETELQLYDVVIYSSRFKEWYYDVLSPVQKRITKAKIEYCDKNKFTVDGKLIKKLQSYNLWEIRYTNIGGGVLRILIYYDEGKRYLLHGFQKNGDGDYAKESDIAIRILESEFCIK